MDTHRVQFTLTGRREVGPPTQKKDLLMSIAAEALWHMLQHGYVLGDGTSAHAESSRVGLTSPARFVIQFNINYPDGAGFPPGDRPEKMLEAIRQDLEASDWSIESEKAQVLS